MLAAAGLLLASCCCCDSESEDSSTIAERDTPSPQPPLGPGSHSNTDNGPTAIARTSSSGKPLDVEPFAREGYLSCWSTSAEIVMYYFGQIRIRQCTQAIEASTVTTLCCDPNTTLISGAPCDEDGYPDFPAWQYDAESSGSPLSWEDARKEIDEGRPFVFSRKEKDDPDTIEHMMVVSGYTIDGNDKLLHVTDPYGFKVAAYEYKIPFSAYAGDSTYENVTNYYRIKVAPGP